MRVLDGRISFDSGVSVAFDKEGIWIHGRPHMGETRTTFISWDEVPELAATLTFFMVQRKENA
jgi:hypothetical protein